MFSMLLIIHSRGYLVTVIIGQNYLVLLVKYIFTTFHFKSAGKEMRQGRARQYERRGGRGKGSKRDREGDKGGRD